VFGLRRLSGLTLGAAGILFFAASAAFALPANVGRPVACATCTSTVGNFNSTTGEIGMYIPLSAGNAGTYGVSGVGTSGGTFYTGPSSTPGSMTMYLRFTPDSGPGNYQLNMIFGDLDLVDANDPFGFFESVDIFYADGTHIALVDEADDYGVTFAVADDNQILQFNDITVPTIPFYIRLVLAADTRAMSSGYRSNTQETLLATLVYTGVPEPATMGMLGAGFIVVAYRRRRQRQAT